MTSPREVSLEIYNLAGTLLHRIGVPSTHGEKQLTWNGRTGAGELAAPGIYLYRLRLDAEAPERLVGTVALVY